MTLVSSCCFPSLPFSSFSVIFFSTYSLSFPALFLPFPFCGFPSLFFLSFLLCYPLFFPFLVFLSSSMAIIFVQTSSVGLVTLTSLPQCCSPCHHLAILLSCCMLLRTAYQVKASVDHSCGCSAQDFPLKFLPMLYDFLMQELTKNKLKLVNQENKQNKAQLHKTVECNDLLRCIRFVAITATFFFSHSFLLHYLIQL